MAACLRQLVAATQGRPRDSERWLCRLLSLLEGRVLAGPLPEDLPDLALELAATRARLADCLSLQVRRRRPDLQRAPSSAPLPPAFAAPRPTPHPPLPLLQGRYREAMPLRFDALDQVCQDLPAGHPTLARLLLSTGADLHAGRVHLESERYLRQGLSMLVAPSSTVPRQEQAAAMALLAEVRRLLLLLLRRRRRRRVLQIGPVWLAASCC